jgi:hypothetical protein
MMLPADMRFGSLAIHANWPEDKRWIEANSDPLLTIRRLLDDVIRQTGIPANRLAIQITTDHFEALATHPAMLARVVLFPHKPHLDHAHLRDLLDIGYVVVVDNDSTIKPFEILALNRGHFEPPIGG